GKTGEPCAGRVVTLSLQHVAVTFEVKTLVMTDERGRIELGHLHGVTRVTASLPLVGMQTWFLLQETATPHTFHVEEKAAVTLPAPRGIGEGDLSLWLSLLDTRAGAPAHDVTAQVKLEHGALLISDLSPGSYLLSSRGYASPI